jgi:hypothetical protein
MNADTFLIWWSAYEVAKEQKREVKNKCTNEQLQYIEPLFVKAFPELHVQGYNYNNSFACDDEYEIKIQNWEESAGINDYCAKIAEKYKEQINELERLEHEAEIAALNAALDMLEQDSKDKLTPEQMKHFREKVNADGWNYERQKFSEWIQKFVNDKRSI